MKSLLLIGVLCCLSMAAVAQRDGDSHDGESSNRSRSGILRFLFKKNRKADSVAKDVKTINDSLNDLQTGIDTLKGSLASFGPVRGIKDSISAVADNAKTQIQNGFDERVSKLKAGLDSLPGVNEFDSLRSKSISAFDRVSRADSLLNRVRSKILTTDELLPVNGKDESPSLKVPGPVDAVASFDMNGVAMPDGIKGVDNSLQPEAVLNINQNTSHLKVLDDPTKAIEGIPDLEPGAIDVNVPELPAGDLGKLKIDEPGLPPALEKGSQALDIANQADIDAKTAEKLESDLASRTELQELTRTEKQIAQHQQEYEALIQRYRDKKALQESIKRKAEGIVNDRLNKTSAVVLKAQEQVAEIRRKSSFNFRSVLTSNSLKDKPFRDRFAPGIAFSTYDNGRFVLETAFQAAYRFSGRFTLGAGAFAHFSFDEENPHFINYEKVNGYRSFVDIGLIKGFFVRAEHEILRKPQFINPHTHIETPALVENSSLIGLGRRFSVSKHFKGTLLVVYKINADGIYPSASKINIRTGLDLNLKKRKKIG